MVTRVLSGGVLHERVVCTNLMGHGRFTYGAELCGNDTPPRHDLLRPDCVFLHNSLLIERESALICGNGTLDLTFSRKE